MNFKNLQNMLLNNPVKFVFMGDVVIVESLELAISVTAPFTGNNEALYEVLIRALASINSIKNAQRDAALCDVVEE